MGALGRSLSEGCEGQWKPGSLPHTPFLAFHSRGGAPGSLLGPSPSCTLCPPASSQGALLPSLGSPLVLPSGCLPAGLWGRFRTLRDLGLCLREGGWAGGAGHHCLCSAKCASRPPAKRGLCCLSAACWLTRCLSSLPAGGPPSSRPRLSPAPGPELYQVGLAPGDCEGCLARAQGWARYPVGTH